MQVHPPPILASVEPRRKQHIQIAVRAPASDSHVARLNRETSFCALNHPPKNLVPYIHDEEEPVSELLFRRDKQPFQTS